MVTFLAPSFRAVPLLYQDHINFPQQIQRLDYTGKFFSRQAKLVWEAGASAYENRFILSE